jgi:hypothetical protein
MVNDWLGYLKGLTLRNVGVIIALALVLIPGYFAYKLTTDNEFASVFFSTYSEAPIPATDCFMRIASVSGGGNDYRVSRPFAYSGQDRWVISIETPNEPDANQAVALCNMLGAIIAYARDPENHPSPVFPGGDIKIFPPSTIPIR